MIGVVLLLLLSATFPKAFAYYTISPGNIRQPISIASLAVASVFSFLFLLQLVHCCIAIAIMRRHRWPYVMLLTAIIFTTIASLTAIAYTVALVNISTLNFRASRAALFLFFYNWSLVFIFIAIMAFLWDRDSMVRSKSSGVNGGRDWVLCIIPVFLIMFMFIFATAQASASANWRFAAVNQVPSGDVWVVTRRTNTVNDLAYTFYAFVIVSAINVLVAAILISRAAKKVSISDKITKTMLFVVSPLYILLNISHFVFLIVLSPSGLLKGAVTFSKLNSIRRADLAQQIINDVLIFFIYAILLFLSFIRASWDSGSALRTSTEEGQQHPTAQVAQIQNPTNTEQPGLREALASTDSGEKA